MNAAGIQIVADWLKHPTYGAAAMLDVLVENELLLEGDDTPGAIEFIGDRTRDDCVAKLVAPPNFPALYVSNDGPVTLSGLVATGQHRKMNIVVSVRVVLRGIESDAKARRYTEYYLRACALSIGELAKNANHSSRQKAGVTLLRAEDLTYGEWAEQIGTAMCTGALVVKWAAEDNVPLS
jgi:hypothetical protein